MASAGSRRFRDSGLQESDSSSDRSEDSSGSARRRRKRRRSDKDDDAQEEPEASDQVMEIPDDADAPFLRKMLDPTSTFPLHLHQQTRVRVSLGFIREEDGRKRQIIVLAGSAQSAFPDCKSRIEELFHMGPDRQQKFLKQFQTNSIVPKPPGSSFSDKKEKDPNVPETVPVSKTESEHSKPVLVPDEVVRYLMTPSNKEAMLETTGADPEWIPDESKVLLRGSLDQVNAGVRAISRVSTHCLWGVSEDKIMRLLKPGHVESMLVRLSPMGVSLKPADKMLSTAGHQMLIGKHPSNDVVVMDALVSRQHAVLELDFDRGAVYVINLSTNGTFLNGKRLPDKNQGKVLVSHGDELLLKDPKVDAEFGYMVNLVDHTVNVWEHTGGGTDVDREHAERLRRKALIGCGN